MKIAITTSGNDLNAPLDSRFGRAPKFLIYDLESKTFEVADNMQNLNAAQGAGIQSAQNVARLGAGAVITGHCGPKAFRVLEAAKIKIYSTAAATVSEAIEQYRDGKLSEAAAADVEEHWA
jgi:predicted Fe-Mo cluster-binding NifX family protein